ncbi:hypothetical protein [Caulobacter radicis]|uniref:hypothetical protein n=1 Tax=Caulobacter radicis TaxID=2172650 RepID=UPI001057A5C3|nr:hypothetical protein [Caulobacter radicis]
MHLKAPDEADAGLPPKDILEQVLRGVEKANIRFGKNFSVRKIFYLPNDSAPVNVYDFLAESIIERICTGEEFMELNLQR